MRITSRDITLVRDIALSHLVSRDQVIELGYFSSITRANTRLRSLAGLGLISRLTTPFFGQSLYMANKAAADIVGERIAPLIEGRVSTPRFIQHALQTTNVRIALTKKLSGTWLFEQQLWRKLPRTGTEVRPDGLLLVNRPTFIEVDMGHAGLPRVKEKLLGYTELAESDYCDRLYGFSDFRLMFITTGLLRSRNLSRASSSASGFDCRILTFKEVGATPITPWS